MDMITKIQGLVKSSGMEVDMEARDQLVILKDLQNFSPPLKITRNSDDSFKLRDTLDGDGFQKQVYAHMARWDGSESCDESAMLAGVRAWLQELRR